MLGALFQSFVRALFGVPSGASSRRGDRRTAPPSSRRKPAGKPPAKSRTLADAAARLGISAEALRAHKPVYQKVRKAKRTGGVRVLCIPDATTRTLQRRLLRRVLNVSRSHTAAFGFERGRSMVDHARLHSDRAVVIGIDIADFFPSTKAKWVYDYFIAVGWDAQAADELTRLTTFEGMLPQGAPTSPKLSNLVNHLLDARLTGLATAFGARYSRYADDIAFSLAVDDTRLVKNLVNLAGMTIYESGYVPHMKAKLFVRRRHQRQQITGLVVNSGPPRLSRETRRWLRAVRHRLATTGKATLTPTQLAGWEAFERMVNHTAD